MFLPDLVVCSRRTVLTTGTRPAAIHIRQGKIIGVMDVGDAPAGCALDDASDLVVMPGVVDTHVHASQTGPANETGFEDTTRAAAAGGVTTIVDMPLTSRPQTTNADRLASKRRAVEGTCFVDVGFWGGVVPGNAADLGGLAATGALGFTCDLAADLRQEMPAVSTLGLPLLVHAELSGPIARAAETARAKQGWMSRVTGSVRASRAYATYLASRPREAENEGVALAIDLCRTYRVRMHILHLSSSDALTPIYHARASRLPLTVETCPHYLSIAADEIPDGDAAFQCEPPIRERENREYLWASLAGGLIQMVASDHRHVSTLSSSLPTMWTEASARGYTLNQLADWMCLGPARLAGLDRKGAIDVGYDADLVIWNPDAPFTAEGAFAARPLRGVVERTYLRGARVYQRGAPAGAGAQGRLL